MSADSLWLDDRYRGRHGIARYAQEVLSRMKTPLRPMGLGGKPASPTDAFRRLPVGPCDTLYSPGYAGFVSRSRQILTVHDLIHLHADWPARARYLAYYDSVVKPAVRRAGVVLTVSESSRSDIQKWVGRGVEVINTGNGCADVFTPGPQPSTAAPYVLFIGNARPHKNFRVLLSAMAIDSSLRVRAVVPTGEVDTLAGRAHAAGVGVDRLEFLSSIDDDRLLELYRDAAVTAIPSTLEGFGLPALESVMCGTPVAYWIGCRSVAEIVGDRGYRVESAENAEEWAATLARALAARERVTPPARSLWDWQTVAERIDDAVARYA